MAKKVFEKGIAKVANSGRKKGVANKITTDIKTAITAVVENRLTELNADLDNMSAFSKWQVIMGMMRFAYPTLSAQKIEADVNNSGTRELIIRYENPIINIDDINKGDVK